MVKTTNQFIISAEHSIFGRLLKEQADELLSARRADRFAEQRMQEVAVCAAVPQKKGS